MKKKEDVKEYITECISQRTKISSDDIIENAVVSEISETLIKTLFYDSDELCAIHNLECSVLLLEPF